MAKYWYDTEFLEGTQKTGFFRRKETAPTIDLISIGILAEDGREYYAVSKEFNLKEAWNRYNIVPYTGPALVHGITEQRVYWIRENVLKPIHAQLAELEGNDCFHEWYDFFSYKSLKYLIGRHGKTRKEIADDIVRFCDNVIQIPIEQAEDYKKKQSVQFFIPHTNPGPEDVAIFDIGDPEFYGYYSAYDHVALCWLFGKMMNLPKGFPMYTRDLKQMFDEAALKMTSHQASMLSYPGVGHDVYSYLETKPDKSFKIDALKKHPDCPKQENEHHALADARWNKKLYEFINSF